MASISINIEGGYSGVNSISVKAIGDGLERYSGIQGNVIFFVEKTGTHTYNVLVSKSNCGTASASFTLTCTEPQVCTEISNINF